MGYLIKIEVVFKSKDGRSTFSRILRSSNILTNSQVERYYAKFCKLNACKIDFITNVTNKNLQFDDYLSNGDFYEHKAIVHAECYGILEYKIRGGIMVYNQNYTEAPGVYVTYQREVDLYTGKVNTIKLQRLQKNGWKNV